MTIPPPTPKDEAERLAALRALDLLDTPPEERFDRITRLAQSLFEAPIAVVSLVDVDREWYKSCQGLSAHEGERAISFCGHTILEDRAFVVEDAASDSRFRDNPMVLGSDGIRFYAGYPVRAPDGSRVGALCVKDFRPRSFNAVEKGLLRDLAALVESELALIGLGKLERELRRRQQHEARLEREIEQFFDLSLDMLCIAGSDGYFKRLNPMWLSVLGYTLDELLAEPFLSFVHPDDRDATAAAAQALGGGEMVVSFENRYRTKSGEYRWFHWAAAPSDEGELIFAVARDVTDRRRSREKLRLAMEVAERANRSKSEFLANMSHELRTPLNSVIGFTNVLLKNRHGRLADKELDYLDRVRSNGEHLLELINEVLDLSKIEAGKLELDIARFDLAELVSEVLAKLDFEGAGLDLRRRIAPSLEPLESDRARLGQVLLNLLGNALKFTKQGSVAVEVGGRAGQAPAWIEVSDTGIGIAAKHLNGIFDAFQQVDGSTSRQFGGSGLGLAISRSLCELMGHRLTVQSQEGEGSTFRIELGSAASRPAVGTTADAAPGDRGRPSSPSSPSPELSPEAKAGAAGSGVPGR